MVEAALLAAPTAEEIDEIEDRVPASALGDNDGGLAAKEMETGTEAALPTLASSEAIREVAETVPTVPAPASAAATEEVAETVTEAEDRSGPALATEPRKTRGKGPKKAAEGEPKEKDIAAMKVAL